MQGEATKLHQMVACRQVSLQAGELGDAPAQKTKAPENRGLGKRHCGLVGGAGERYRPLSRTYCLNSGHKVTEKSSYATSPITLSVYFTACF